MKTMHLVTSAVLAGAVGCAPAVPKELADARAAYSRAQDGVAAQYAPADLHNAHVVLSAAEQSFANDPDSRRTRDLSYIAERKAEQAEAAGNLTKAEHDRRMLKDELANAKNEIRTKELAQTKEQLLESEKSRNLSEEQLAAERRARGEAEQRADDAMKELAKIAKVQETERGTVITLSGSVLFAFNEATLLPSARRALDDVSTALKDRKGTFVIEGYTDSVGSAAYNEQLSKKRAEAVADYLTSHGVERAQIKTVGKGEENPIASNSTAEGRANNRRVEIVIERKTANR
jgi:outer membrane protein OmpA-like peptidoglycan-associated protein